MHVFPPPDEGSGQQAQGYLGNWHPSLVLAAPNMGMWLGRCELNCYTRSGLKLGPNFETRRVARIPIG